MTSTALEGSPARSRPGGLALLWVGLARLFVFGATVGSFLDAFHTHGGATSYPHPVFFAMAWWTPPLFGAAYALLALTYRQNEPRPRVAIRPARAALGFVVFAALYFASGFLPPVNGVKLAVLLVGAGLLFAFVDRSRAALVTGVVSAFLGPAFEVALVRAGVFMHLQPDFLGIPMWLPALYLASGPGVGGLASLLLGGRTNALAAPAQPE